LNIEIPSNLEYNNSIKQLKLSIRGDFRPIKLSNNDIVINNCIIESVDRSNFLEEVFSDDGGQLIKRGLQWKFK